MINLGQKYAYIIEQHGGIPEFSSEDVESVVSKKNKFSFKKLSDRLYSSECTEEAVHDLAFMKRYGEIIGVFDNLEDIKDLSLPDGKFYIRVIDHGGCHGTEHESIIGNQLNARGRVSFNHNDFVVLIFHIDLWYVTLEHVKKDVKRNERRAPMRPYFTPISMDPQFAAFLVNMGYFSKGSRLLDPFCGSGGILIEAGLKGFHVSGIDILPQMAMGATVNLKFYGIKNFSIQKEDFLKMEKYEKYDGIITDFPYGRNSHISTSHEIFYTQCAEVMNQVLNPGSRACIVTDNPDNLEFFRSYFTVDKILRQRVHASLTRNFVRLIKN